MISKNTNRNSDIFTRAMRGEGYRVIGARYSISRERVRQLIYNELRRKGFPFSGVPGRHDVETARKLYGS